MKDAVELQSLTDDQLKRFQGELYRMARNIPGSSSEMESKRKELHAMHEQLTLEEDSPPAVFATESFADTHDPHLHRLLVAHAGVGGTQKDPFSSTCPDPYKARIALVRDSPGVAVWFFDQKVKLFHEKIMGPILGFTDWWTRYEYQHRGSIHAHEFYHHPKAPALDFLDDIRDEIQAEVDEAKVPVESDEVAERVSDRSLWYSTVNVGFERTRLDVSSVESEMGAGAANEAINSKAASGELTLAQAATLRLSIERHRDPDEGTEEPDEDTDNYDGSPPRAWTTDSNENDQRRILDTASTIQRALAWWDGMVDASNFFYNEAESRVVPRSRQWADFELPLQHADEVSKRHPAAADPFCDELGHGCPLLASRPPAAQEFASPASQLPEALEREYQRLRCATCRHDRCSSYCLRKTKKGEVFCRFAKYLEVRHAAPERPAVSHFYAEVAQNGKNYVWKHYRERSSDPRINMCMPLQMQCFRSNCDAKPIVSRIGVAEYAAKAAANYATKREPPSKTLSDLLHKNISNDGASVARPFQSTLFSLESRDFSAMEVMAVLMGIPVVTCSRKFIHKTIDLEGRQAVEELEDDAGQQGDEKRKEAAAAAGAPDGAGGPFGIDSAKTKSRAICLKKRPIDEYFDRVTILKLQYKQRRSLLRAEFDAKQDALTTKRSRRPETNSKALRDDNDLREELQSKLAALEQEELKGKEALLLLSFNQFYQTVHVQFSNARTTPAFVAKEDGDCWRYKLVRCIYSVKRDGYEARPIVVVHPRLPRRFRNKGECEQTKAMHEKYCKVKLLTYKPFAHRGAFDEYMQSHDGSFHEAYEAFVESLPEDHPAKLDFNSGVELDDELDAEGELIDDDGGDEHIDEFLALHSVKGLKAQGDNIDGGFAGP